MNRHLCATGLLLLAATSLCAQQRGSFTLTFTDSASGSPRSVQMWVPEHDGSTGLPLFVAYHGAAMNGSEMRSLLRPVAERLGTIFDAPAILAAPEYTGLSYAAIDAMLDSTLAFLGRHYPIDMRQAVITGFSWGGRIAYRIGLERPEVFAGIIGLAPALDTTTITLAMWRNVDRMRMATILGDRDFAYGQVKGAMEAIARRGGAVLYIEKPGVMHTDPVYFASSEFVDDYVRSFEFVTSIPTSSVERHSVELLQATPTPARDVVRIDGASDVAIERIDVIDILGAVVRSEAAGGRSSAWLDVSTLPPGLYVLQIAATNGTHRGTIRVVR